MDRKVFVGERQRKERGKLKVSGDRQFLPSRLGTVLHVNNDSWETIKRILCSCDLSPKTLLQWHLRRSGSPRVLCTPDTPTTPVSSLYHEDPRRVEHPSCTFSHTRALPGQHGYEEYGSLALLYTCVQCSTGSVSSPRALQPT